MTRIGIDVSADLAVPLLARAQQQAWQWLGETDVSVPAGEFRADHYRSGDNDIWVLGPDRLVVRYVVPRADSEFVLVRLDEAQP
ncbi:MAG: hypothetical protein NZM12_14350 [Steroidobacteraceae bacterium]|nr:hypothetical protein [Steroidobacteraceae bacterium]